MTPKEKAKELVDKYTNLYPSYIVMFPSDIDNAIKDIKECALVAVDEILTAITFNMYDEDAYNKEDIYWEEVKEEIENL